MGTREQDIDRWLARVLPGVTLRREPASDDASFRRYFRIHRGDAASLVLMDAPPAHEDCRPFVDVARRLRAAGVHAPEVLAQDLDQGLLLLTDLGATAYLDRLSPRSADALYQDAIATLVRMQAHVDTGGLPEYDAARLHQEMDLFDEWFVRGHLARSLTPSQHERLQQARTRLAQACLEQPRVFVHRDYHSRNLMVLETPDGDARGNGVDLAAGNPGVLDFQDAVLGPVAYDLVSLLRDVYVAWEPAQVQRWVEHYRQQAMRCAVLRDVSEACLQRWFDLTGLQRHLKVAGIFARLFYRDGKPRYLGDLPLTLRYLREVSACYDEMDGLSALLDELDVDAASAAATRKAQESRP
jgi:aminoglycoside/choline kinase family phosphotransferase